MYSPGSGNGGSVWCCVVPPIPGHIEVTVAAEKKIILIKKEINLRK